MSRAVGCQSNTRICKQRLLKPVDNDMKSIVKAIEESSDLKEFLSNPSKKTRH
jgi:F0F1-type ATP synthase delta subunit